MCDSESPVVRRAPMPSATTARLKEWFIEHQDNPYPSLEQKQGLLYQLDISESQLKNWLANARKRNWTPMRMGARPPQNDFERAFLIARAPTLYGDELDDLVLPESYFDSFPLDPVAPGQWLGEEDLLHMDLQEIDSLLAAAMTPPTEAFPPRKRFRNQVE